MDKSVFTLGVILSLKDEISGKLKSVRGEWDNLRKSMMDGGKEAKLFDSSLSALKTGGIMSAAGIGLGKVVSNLAEASLEAGKLSAEIRSLGVSQSEIEKITTASRNMSAEMGISQETFLSGIYDIKSAVSSLDPSQLGAVAGAVGNLSIATKGDFKGLADLFGTAHAQFKDMYSGMSDSDFAGLFGNTLSRAVQMYKTDGAKMQQAMESLGASASIMGISFEEQTAVLGRLQNTMQAGVAGTAFRSFLVNSSKGMTQLGLSTVDAQGKMLAMPDLLEQIKLKYGEAIDPKEMQELSNAFGQEGAAAVSTLLGKITDLRAEIGLFKDGNKDMNWSAMEQMKNINLDSGVSQINRLSEGWKSFKTIFGSGISEGHLKGLAGGLADILGGLTKFLGEHPRVAKFMGLFVVGLAGALTLGGAIISLAGIVGMYAAIKKISWVVETYDALAKGANAIKTGILTAATWASSAAHGTYNMIMKVGLAGTIAYGIATAGAAVKTGLMSAAQWALNAAMSANPIGLIIVGIGLLIGLGVLLVKNWDIVKEKFSGFWGKIKSSWSDIPGWVKGILILPLIPFIGLPLLIYKNWDSIKTFFTGFWDVVKNKWNGTPGWIKNLIGFIMLPFAPFISLPFLIIRNWNNIKSFFGGLPAVISQGFKNVFNPIYASALTAGKKFIDTFIGGIKSKIGSISEPIKSLGNTIMSWLPQSDAKQGPLSNISKSGKSFVTTWNSGVENEAGKSNSVKTFAQIQAKSITEETPVVQQLSGLKSSSKTLSAKSLINSLIININGKNMTISETLDELNKVLEYHLMKEGFSDGTV